MSAVSEFSRFSNQLASIAMKRFIAFTLILAVAAVIVGCNESPLAGEFSITPLPPSFKGYELYSWQDGGDWYFTLITGTNRTKTIAEITSQVNVIGDDGWLKITVLGIDELLALLERLPPSEHVFWLDGRRIDEPGGLIFPQNGDVDLVRQHSQRIGIELELVE